MHTEGSAGHILSILRSGGPHTRSELAELTGQARTTVAVRLDALMEAGLVRETVEAATTGGRPSAAFEFNSSDNFAVAIDLGARHATYAITDFRGAVLAHATDAISINDGPGAVMNLVQHRLDALLERLDLTPRRVRTAGIGLPGPVDHHSGRPTCPPIMPGWDGYDARALLGAHFDCPVFVDNDANVLALGERAVTYPEVADLLFAKVATGIGAGIISSGRLLHGAAGAAGDLGHIHAPAAGCRPCRCGNRGCLETLASSQAIAATLTSQGIPTSSPGDIIALIREGNMHAVQALREAGRALGDVLATCTALFNPTVIVLGGEIVAAGEPLMAGVRESVYSRALPLAGRNLRVTAAQSGALGGVIGAAHMAIDRALSFDSLDTPSVPAGAERRPAAV